ncbi:MAG: ribosome-associated protein [Mariniblastus sp.]|jgi:ribosome-associated protein
MLNVDQRISIRLTEFKFSYARSPGPGGQNVNKVNSKVILKWSLGKTKALPTTVQLRFEKKYANRITQDGNFVISSHRFRDQGRNVADCLSKLRELILAVAAEPKPRKKKKVSKSAKLRRLENKRRASATKQSRRSVQRDD